MSKTEAKALKILREWILEFHNYGDKFDCIEIIHDGYVERDDGSSDENEYIYAIFINEKSHLIEEFPPIDRFVSSFASMVGHRNEDYCLYAVVNNNTQAVDINMSSDEPGKLSWESAAQIVAAIDKKYSA